MLTVVDFEKSQGNDEKVIFVTSFSHTHSHVSTIDLSQYAILFTTIHCRVTFHREKNHLSFTNFHSFHQKTMTEQETPIAWSKVEGQNDNVMIKVS